MPLLWSMFRCSLVQSQVARPTTTHTLPEEEEGGMGWRGTGKRKKTSFVMSCPLLRINGPAGAGEREGGKAREGAIKDE